MKVGYISHMGDDASIVNAARVSFSKQADQYTEEANTRLIKFLARHHHITPFMHTAITFRMKAPVPIRTQCFKHKVGFVENEESRRYITSQPELYIPEEFRTVPDGSIKQGSGGRHPHSNMFQDLYITQCDNAIDLYEDMIAAGVCPEQARFVLPQGVHVNWIWTGNLASFARFYNQRTDSTAQKEIQELAEQVGAIIAPLFPVAWEALTSEK